jgi:hypothetical protein
MVGERAPHEVAAGRQPRLDVGHTAGERRRDAIVVAPGATTEDEVVLVLAG